MSASQGEFRPIFLVGSERSGTTLLRLMLDHHPELAFFSEFEFAVERVTDDGGLPPVADYCEWLRIDRIFLDSGFSADSSLGYRELVTSFLEQKRRRDGKQHVGATVHKHFHRLLHLWPSARFIHLIRDPRDVARSTIQMGWAGNIWAGVERWIEAEQSWGVLVRELPRDAWTELHYEALVADPESELQQICASMGLPYDAGMLRYPETSSYKAPDPALMSRWRDKLTNEELALAEQRIGALLEQRGYQPSGAPRLEITARMERRLRLQDRCEKLRFRIKRYGVTLFCAELMLRRLGLIALHGRVLLRMHKITRRHLR